MACSMITTGVLLLILVALCRCADNPDEFKRGVVRLGKKRDDGVQHQQFRPATHFFHSRVGDGKRQDSPWLRPWFNQQHSDIDQWAEGEKRGAVRLGKRGVVRLGKRDQVDVTKKGFVRFADKRGIVRLGKRDLEDEGAEMLGPGSLLNILDQRL